MSGAGGETYRRLASAGKAGGDRLSNALRNMRGKVPVENVVQSAKEGIKTMKDKMYSEYNKQMSGIAGADRPIDFGEVTSAYRKIADGFKFKGKSIAGKGTQKKLNEIEEVLNDWGNSPEMHTTLGLDALKKRVYDLMPKATTTDKSGAAVKQMYGAIKDTIVKKSPEYADVMKQYEASINQIDDIAKEMSVNGNVGTAMRKLQSITRNNANTNYGNRLNMAKALESGGGVSILDDVAGQAANSLAPRGIQSLAPTATGMGVWAGAPPELAALLPMMSPRIMGEAAVAVGRGGRAVEMLANKLGVTEQAIKYLAQIGAKESGLPAENAAGASNYVERIPADLASALRSR